MSDLTLFHWGRLLCFWHEEGVTGLGLDGMAFFFLLGHMGFWNMGYRTTSGRPRWLFRLLSLFLLLFGERWQRGALYGRQWSF